MNKRIARFFIEFPILMFILETLSFIVGWQITTFPFIIAWIGLLIFELYSISNLSDKLIFVITSLLITTICICIMTYLYDTSFDGQWYHSAVILLQQQGWNPFYNPIITPDTEPYSTNTHLWISHYAKGMETIESGIVALTGNLESGKAVNLFFIVSIIGFAYSFLKKLLPNHKKYIIMGMTTITVLNPVVINQTFTYYIDYTSYIFIVIGCILIYDVIILKEKRSIITLLLIGFFVPTIKMNISFWVILIMTLFLVAIWLRTKQLKKTVFWKMVIAVFLGFVVGGFNPYVTNIYLKGDVLYPLNGPDRERVEKMSMPDMMWGKSRLYQANYSLIVNPYSNDAKRHGNTHIPSVSKDDIMDSARHDVQLGGFGIFFFEAIVLLLVLFFTLPKTYRWKYVGVGLLILYSSLFLLPSGSLARYVPFFYLFPLMIVLLALKEKLCIYQKCILGLSVGMLFLNAGISLTGVSAMVVQQKIQNDYIVKELKAYDKTVYVRSPSCQLYEKLKKAEVPFTIEKTDEGTFYEIDMVGCDPVISAPISIFRIGDQPLLMKKVPMFQLKITELRGRDLTK